MKFITLLWQKLGVFLYASLGRFIVPLMLNNTQRTRVLLIKDDEYLLCKTWLSHGKWSLPGGGIKKNEDIALAAVREVKEELNIELNHDLLTSLGTSQYEHGAVHFTVHIFAYKVENASIKLQWPEIVDARWFDKNSLPKDLNSGTKKAIDLHSQEH